MPQVLEAGGGDGGQAEADPMLLGELLHWVDSLHPDGGTTLAQALDTVISTFPGARHMCVACDGQCGDGKSLEQWGAFLKQSKFRDVKFHFYAVAKDADTTMMQGMQTLDPEFTYHEFM